MVSVSERLKQKKQQVVDRQAGRQNTYRFKLAETEIRLLPSWRPADHEDPEAFFHDFGMTWVKDFDGNVLAVVGDRKLTFGEEDDVRALVNTALARAKSDAQRKHYKEMLASPRVLCGGLVLNDPDVDLTEPQILEFSEAQWTGPITDIIVDAEKEGDNVVDLANGFNITVKKSGKGWETKYSFTLARKSSKVDASVMTKVHDIDAFIRAKFADGERARNAIRSLMGGETLAITDRATDLSVDRDNRLTDETDVGSITDADYSEVSSENDAIEDVVVTEEDINSLFD